MALHGPWCIKQSRDQVGVCRNLAHLHAADASIGVALQMPMQHVHDLQKQPLEDAAECLDELRRMLTGMVQLVELQLVGCMLCPNVKGRFARHSLAC